MQLTQTIAKQTNGEAEGGAREAEEGHLGLLVGQRKQKYSGVGRDIPTLAEHLDHRQEEGQASE